MKDDLEKNVEKLMKANRERWLGAVQGQLLKAGENLVLLDLNWKKKYVMFCTKIKAVGTHTLLHAHPYIQSVWLLEIYTRVNKYLYVQLSALTIMSF